MTAEKKRLSGGVEVKKKIVEKLAEKIRNSRTILIASIKGLPSSQFHSIKKKLRGKAEIVIAKKSLILRAIGKIEKGVLQNLNEKIGADVALFFSNLDAFELSGALGDNESPTRAKGGEIAPEDIVVEPGPTELMPGPAISELSGVGLKVAVENGKLTIKKQATIVRAGETINSKVASVLGKLNISPIKVGFEPVAAYDTQEDKIYFDIKIDKKGTLEALRTAIDKGLGFAVKVGYINENTISFFISKAGAEYNVLEKLIGEKPTEKNEEVKEEGK